MKSYTLKRKRYGGRRVMIRPRFYIILSVFFALILTLVLTVVLRDRQYTATIGTLTGETSLSAVVLRDETVTAAEETGGVNFLLPDGSHVDRGDAVCEVYLAGFDTSARDELSKLKSSIEAYIRQDILGEIIDDDLAKLDSEIDAASSELARLIASGSPDAELAEDTLDALLSERDSYLLRNSDQSEALLSMYKRQEELEKEIRDGTVRVSTPITGLLGTSLDGCEHLLNIDALATLDSRSLRSIVKNSELNASTQAASYTPLFRIANESAWYCLIDLSDHDGIVPGESYRIKTALTGDAEMNAVALSDMDYASRGLAVLKVDSSPAPVLNARQLDIVVITEANGLVVPKKALYNVSGEIGVYVEKAGERNFVPVELLYSRAGRSVVRAKGENDLPDGVLLRTK